MKTVAEIQRPRDWFLKSDLDLWVLYTGPNARLAESAQQELAARKQLGRHSVNGHSFQHGGAPASLSPWILRK
jgi:hypothetical protein